MSDGTWRTNGIDPEAHAALAEGLPASELWSLLLDVFARRAGRRTPASLLQQWERDGFTRAAPIDQRTLVELDGHLLAAAGHFDAIELSPLAPLGACSVVGLASQNKVVSALRGTEIVADPTNVLVLECARRLRADTRRTDVRLATCHRCVRAQPLPPGPGFAPHFRIFCLASAGHEVKDQAFVVNALVDHITTHLRALDRLEAHGGYAFAHRGLTLLATAARAPLADRIEQALGASGVNSGPIERRPLEHRYYDGLRFMIGARPPGDDEDSPIIDGGAFDWLGTIAANRKLAYVASGMGAQRVADIFRTGATQRRRSV